jgi:hypothetical protein
MGWLITAIFSDWELPSLWIANAAAALPENPPLQPFNLSGLVTNGGVFFGFTSGAIFWANRGGWRIAGNRFHLVARYILGLAGLLIIYIGLDLLFPAGESLVAFIFRYLRYAIAGVWVSAFAPILFRKLNLMYS